MKNLTIFTIICLCSTYSLAQDTFSYDNPKPDYVVGKLITPNSPNIAIAGAKFSIVPSLSSGLSLDQTSGTISGTPLEQYQAYYIITLTSPDGTIKKANINMLIWDVPKVLTCGLTKLFIASDETDSFPCKSDKYVNSWSINFNPAGSYPITISNSGVLQLNNFSPPDNPITVTLNAENPAGKSANSTSIIISKSDVVIKSGLNVKVDKVNSFMCGNENAIKTIYNSKTTIIDNLDGLDGSDAYTVWDNKLGGFLSTYNAKWWNYTIEAAIFAPEKGGYKIHYNTDYTSYQIYIDDKVSDIYEFGYGYTDKSVYYYTQCSVWEESDWSTNIELTAGYHTFKIVGHYAVKVELCNNGNSNDICNELSRDSTYRFMLRWTPPGKTSEESVQYYYYIKVYNVISYLTFDSDYFTMPINSYFEIPFKIERGKPSECTTGDNRITIDLTKYILTGQIDVESNLKLTIQCSTETSTTNAVILYVDIVDRYVKGIVAYYLKSDEFDKSCSSPYTTSTGGVTTEFIRLEDDINQEYNPIQSVWDGLTPNFASEFGVNWEGYIKIETSGSYIFNLTSVQGSWLFIDFVELINQKGVHDWSSKTGTKSLTAGYHFIRVNYMKNIGASGIKLSYKNEIDSSFENLIGKLYFVPRGDFEYRVSYAVYIVNNRISDNIPFTEGDQLISECVSDPSLPPGLELSGCIIRGTPTTVQDVTSYVISGKLSDGKIIMSTIQITIIADIKPQGLHLVDLDNGGISITELNLFIGNESHLLISVDSGAVISYELPVVPQGFKYDKYKGSITAISTEYLTNYELEIRAYYFNSEYVSTKIVTNVISGCSGEYKPHFVKVVDSKSPRAEIMCRFEYTNETTIYGYTIPSGSPPLYFPSLCLIPGDYRFYASDFEDGDGSFFFEFYTDGKLADRIDMKYYGYGTYRINTVPKSPVIVYSNVIEEFYLNEEVKIVPIVKLLDSCKVSPDLPSFLHFNSTNCAIAGKVTGESPKQLYKIIGSNVNGITTRFLNLTFYGDIIENLCSKQGKSMIEIHVNASEYTSPSLWTYNLYKTSEMDNDNKSSIIELKGSDEGWESGKIYEYIYCISNDEYTSFYRTSNSYSGYGNGFIDVLVDGIPVDRTSLAYYVMKKEKNFHSTLDCGYNTVWENSIQYEDGWDNPNSQHSTWSKSKLSELNKVSGNVIYIRKIDTFGELDKYNAFALKVSYISGVVIKVNGKEIFRNNLPNGEISPSTMANNRFDVLTAEVFILPITWLEENPFEISIELHKFNGESNFPEVSSSLLRIIGSEQDCLILNKYSNRVTETNTKAYRYHISYAFDENPNSKFYISTNSGWGIMRYKDHFHPYFTQFSINAYSTDDTPKDFTVEGLYNSQWILIGNYVGITYPENKKRVFTDYNTTVMYSAIKISITNTTGSNIDVNDINFHLCPIRYCKAVEGIPETMTGTETIVGCKTSGIIGNRTLYCNNDKSWSEIKNSCNESPSLISKETSYTFKAGSFYENKRLFTVSGKDVIYSMVTEISGLRIDNKTGLISGQPYIEQSSKPVYFKASNPYLSDGITIEIAITVLPSNIPIKIWSNESVILDAGKMYKDYQLFYVTGENIKYSVDKLPKGLNMNKNSGLINGMTIEESSMKCTFTASNNADYIHIMMEINVTLSSEPNNIKYEKEVKMIFGMNYKDLQPYLCLAKTILYSVTPALPDGLKLDGNSGMISGKVNTEPPSSNSYTFKCYNDNGEVSNPITITTEESVEPVIINHIDSITIEGGKEYDGLELGRITGKNLVYSIIPNLPSTSLKFDSSSGRISGYISSSFNSIDTTILVSGSGKQVSFSFILSSSIPTKPVIIPSSKISSIKFKFGEAIKSIYLFVAVGTNLEISVNPELPKGISLDSKSGEIYGIPIIYVEKTKYTFTIKNPPSVETLTVNVDIEFDAIYCESDSGFVRSPAERGGREVSIKCGVTKSGLKRRKCLLTDDNKSVWGKIDDSECKTSSAAITGIAIGSVAGGLIVIMVIIFCLLRTGMFRRRAKSQSSLNRQSMSEKQNPDGIRM